MSNYPVQDFFFKRLPWTSVIYAKRRYPYSWRTLIEVWRESEGGKVNFLGAMQSRPQNFFYRLAGKVFDECDTYACVYGCCSVIWHPIEGNWGGMGIPGCPCDDMEDPRDLTKGIL